MSSRKTAEKKIEKVVKVDEAIKNEDVDNSEDEGDDDMFKIFSIMFDSVDAMKEKFIVYYDEPNQHTFKEFDGLITDFIGLTRDLRSLSKSLLPKTEKVKKVNETRGRKKQVVVAIQHNIPEIN